MYVSIYGVPDAILNKLRAKVKIQHSENIFSAPFKWENACEMENVHKDTRECVRIIQSILSWHLEEVIKILHILFIFSCHWYRNVSLALKSRADFVGCISLQRWLSLLITSFVHMELSSQCDFDHNNIWEIF